MLIKKNSWINGYLNKYFLLLISGKPLDKFITSKFFIESEMILLIKIIKIILIS